MYSDGRDSESKNIEIRQIDNGFIKRESTWRGSEYKCCETYSAQRPSLDDMPDTNAGQETFRAAIKALK